MKRLILVTIITLITFSCINTREGAIHYELYDSTNVSIVNKEIQYKGKFIDGVLLVDTEKQEQIEYERGFLLAEYTDKAFEKAKENVNIYEKENDIKGDVVYSFYKNGAIKTVTPYVNNKLTGSEKWYYADGNLNAEFPFKDGLVDGIGRWYSEGGILVIETTYKAGKKEGIEKWYTPEGQVELEIMYENDEEIWSESK